jgi:hypothetical protein
MSLKRILLNKLQEDLAVDRDRVKGGKSCTVSQEAARGIPPFFKNM